MARGALARPQGTITRGTTGSNRLRRSDRWLVHSPQVRRALARTPLVVDLGYGARPVTTVELATRLHRLQPALQVVGLEIDPARVVGAQSASTAAVGFRRGGFELAGLRPGLVRAFNVLRQYPEDAVAAAWSRMQAALAPDGVIIEGTCDELGRRCVWVTLSQAGPQTLTFAWDPFDVATPSQLAARLPKALIHHNVDGQAVHALLDTVVRCWAAAAPHAPFGPRVRWRHTLALLKADHVEVLNQRGRARDCILTVPWSCVDPRQLDTAAALARMDP